MTTDGTKNNYRGGNSTPDRHWRGLLVFKVTMATLGALLLMPLVLVTPAQANGSKHRNVTWQQVVREWNEDGTSAPGNEVVGWSRLTRTERGMRAKVGVGGLKQTRTDT